MGFKDILVHVDATPASQARLDFAAHFAKEHEAHLVALHVEAAPYVPADIMATGMAASVLQWQRELRRHREAEVGGKVEAARQRHGIEIEWRAIEGDVDDTLALHGRYVDLVIIGPGSDSLDLEQPELPSPGHVVIATGRPVLVLPKDYKAKSFGERILLGWKSTPEAARAVHDALPLLAKARNVTVTEVNPDLAGGRRVAGGDIAKYLARHGVAVTVSPVVAPDMDAGSLLLARAADIEADLIVMGAYGHSRLREAVLGGATRYILDHLDIPVLMAS